ncbi:MAG: hypothetical protein CFE22_10015 [Cytophagaceae bacterium BCCC1]|nr:MAG: hypothetical protein CFE22_10015 [Cytophagaceae bacterium BCCC1]
MKKIFILLLLTYNTFSQNVLQNNNTSVSITPEGISSRNTNSEDNIRIGLHALRDNTGGDNIAIGNLAMLLGSGGKFNIAIGGQALFNTSGQQNVVIGGGIINSMSIGSYNTAIGSGALGLTYKGKNTAVGVQAGYGSANNDDSSGVYLGYQAGKNEPGSNKLYISNTDTENLLIWGDFYAAKLGFHGKVGIGTKNPLTNLHIYQTAGHSQILLNNSNIGTTLTDGLSLISDTNGDAHILNKENKPLNFGANNFGSYMTVYPAGEVGIGLLGFLPSANLHLHETEAGQATKFKISNAFSSLYGNDGFMFEYSTQGEMLMNNLETQNIILNSNPYNSTPELFVSGSSRVGIGTSNPTTKFEVNGFTKLGSDAPSIKIKKLTIQTASSDVEPNNITYVPHGLNGAKILGVQVLVEYALNQYVPNAFTNNPSYEFHYLVNNTNDIEIKVKPGNSSSILNKTAKILITYEE